MQKVVEYEIVTAAIFILVGASLLIYLGGISFSVLLAYIGLGFLLAGLIEVLHLAIHHTRNR